MGEDHGRITFTADEAAAAALSQALVESGALIRAMAPETVTLEDLFFKLTEGDGVPSPGPDGPAQPETAERRRSGAAPLMPGVATVYRWELFKLRHPEAHLHRSGRGHHRPHPVRAGHPPAPPPGPRRRLCLL